MTLDPQLLTDTDKTLLRARRAARRLAPASTADKDTFLRRVSGLLRERAGQIAARNRLDIERAEGAGKTAAFIDRLGLQEDAVGRLAAAVDELRALPDPVGRTTWGARRPNGLWVSKVRIPLGVIGMIYESRPNVTIDAGCLCIKAGNAVVLRGGSDARETNDALLRLLRDALRDSGLPEDGAQAPAGIGHDAVRALISRPQGLDLVIPRGGKALITAVTSQARVPVIQHYEGVCHVFVHASADLQRAVAIAVNAKAQRPGVCNAMEALLVDAAIADEAVPALVQALIDAGVEVRGCPQTVARHPGARPAEPSDYGREFLDLIALVAVVEGLQGALDHIERWGSGHTEAIVAQDVDAAQAFASRVDASCVMLNASTRFNDGGELGLGAEIGISTSKLHAYGPMGLQSLTTEKYLVTGQGHVRS